MPLPPIVAFALVVLVAACAPPSGEGSSPLAGRILDVDAGRMIDEGRLVAELEQSDFVLLGERHDNPDHHRLQARLVRELQPRWPRPAPVAFEMIETDQQLTITEHLQTSDDDAAGLGAALDWERSGWPDWAMYVPIAEAAVEAGAEIVAANLPEGEVRTVYARGPAVLDRALLQRTGLDEPLPPLLEADLRSELAEAHCGDLSAASVEGMVRVQRARDAVMADRLARLAGNGRGILIAGAGHVRADRGVPWYLERLRPGSTTASVAFVEVAGDVTRPPVPLPFDYVWFTDAVERPDPCAVVGASLERLGARDPAARAPSG